MKLLSTIIQANTERLNNVGRTLSVYLDIGLSQQDFKSINDGLTLVHRPRCWSNVKPILMIQRLVYAGISTRCEGLVLK